MNRKKNTLSVANSEEGGDAARLSGTKFPQLQGSGGVRR